MTSDAQFDATIAAFARYSARPRISEEEQKRRDAERHRNDPKHVKALAKRRKAKRGGPR